MKKTLKNLLAAAFWIAVWWLLAARIGSQLLLPTPPATIARLFALAGTAELWRTVFTTLLRILLGAAVGVVLGTLLAVLTCSVSLLRTLFAPLLTVIKSTPVASFIILLIIWLGRDVLPAAIVVLMVLPVVWANVSAGIDGTDRQLLELAAVYRFPPLRTLRRVYIPAVLPHFLAACRSTLGLAWKAGVAAEVLTMPAVSVGRKLADAKSYSETLDLFAWTLVVIICSLLIEHLLMRAISRIGGGKA